MIWTQNQAKMKEVKDGEKRQTSAWVRNFRLMSANFELNTLRQCVSIRVHAQFQSHGA